MGSKVRGWVEVVAVLALSCLGLRSEPGSAPTGVPKLMVRVYDRSSLTASTLTRAEHEVKEAFKAAGIEIRWVDCIAHESAEALCAGELSTGVARMTIMPGHVRQSAELISWQTFGVTLPTGVLVFSDRTRDFAEWYGFSHADVLAVIMAHELGHVMLGPRHFRKGLMSAHLLPADFRSFGARLRFSDEERDLLQPKLSSTSDCESLLAAGDSSYLQGRLLEAEKSYALALQQAEAFPPGETRRCRSLQRLASVLREEAKFYEAEGLYRRALTESEGVFGERSPEVAVALNGLAMLYSNTQRYSQAETAYQRALSIFRNSPGPQSEKYALTLNNLGWVYLLQGRYELAEPILEQALEVFRTKANCGAATGDALNNLAVLKLKTGKLPEADVLYQAAVAAYAESLGPHHPMFATILDNRAMLLARMGRNSEAEPLFRRSVSLFEEAFGAQSPRLRNVLTNYASFLRATHRNKEAKKLESRVAHIEGQRPDGGAVGMTVDVSSLHTK
jgi:tetratricopeptide (TPR) repeat protein